MKLFFISSYSVIFSFTINWCDLMILFSLFSGFIFLQSVCQLSFQQSSFCVLGAMRIVLTQWLHTRRQSPFFHYLPHKPIPCLNHFMESPCSSPSWIQNYRMNHRSFYMPSINAISLIPRPSLSKWKKWI